MTTQSKVLSWVKAVPPEASNRGPISIPNIKGSCALPSGQSTALHPSSPAWLIVQFLGRDKAYYTLWFQEMLTKAESEFLPSAFFTIFQCSFVLFNYLIEKTIHFFVYIFHAASYWEGNWGRNFVASIHNQEQENKRNGRLLVSTELNVLTLNTIHGPWPGNGAAHSKLGFPISVNNQDKAHRPS